MKKTRIILPVLALVAIGSGISVAQFKSVPPDPEITTIQTMIVARGSVSLQLDTSRLNGIASKTPVQETLQFDAVADSFLPFVIANDTFRAATPGAIGLLAKNTTTLPQVLTASLANLVLERQQFGEAYELVVRDMQSGFTFFNVEGVSYEYDAAKQSIAMRDARLLISPEFAQQLGRPSEAGAAAGTVSFAAVLRAIEVQRVVNGQAQASSLPADAPEGRTSGPDVIVGDMPSMVQSQSGNVNGRVGLAIATTSCNNGNVPLNWTALPNTDHPVIPQNLYRMSGGTSNSERFEQIGQSWLKHAFTALQQNACGFGCQPASPRLGVGCSDPYDTGLNGSQTGLGSRAWVHPFTGFFPGGTNANGLPTSRDHTGHTHDVTSHRVLVPQTDLNPSLNPGAIYFAESQYVTPHEYVWCRDNPGQCGPDHNTDNNSSYRRFNVSGTSNFAFSAAGATVRELPAIYAWTGATVNQLRPAPGQDGRALIGYKVTGPVNGVYQYRYAVYNQNLDRSIQSFSVPLGCGVTIDNVGFQAPLNHPGSLNDGTVNSAGYSNTPWTPVQDSSAITWSSETFAANPNANAIRWGTMYTFRFDSTRPPETVNATVGFFKTGEPMMVQIQAPSAACAALTMSDAVSRKTHGAAGTFDVQLPLSGTPGIEPRRSGGNHTIVLTFSNDVVSGDASVTVGGAQVAGSPTFSGNTMTVQLSNAGNAEEITLSLNGVTDSFGQTMAPTFLTFKSLFGDANRNSSVTASDIGMVKANSGQQVTQANFTADVTADGSVTASDIGATKSMAGTTLP